MKAPPDQRDRQRAIDARDQTVLIDAGAGAGKTTILVARIVALVAPPADADAAIPIERLVAVTFTRRAAGELRLRIRQVLLKALSTSVLTPLRRARLLAALDGLDAAAVGTIHGFADRLLRLEPMKARLSPAYQIHEDAEALALEAFARLRHAVQAGTLREELPRMAAAEVREVERSLSELIRAGVLVHSVEREPIPARVGLDALAVALIENRDRELAVEPTFKFPRKRWVATAQAVLASLAPIKDDGTRGARWLISTRTSLGKLVVDPQPLSLLPLIKRMKGGAALRPKKDFVQGSPALAAFGELVGTGRSKGKSDRIIQLTAPIHAEVATRLVRARHVIVALYEQVKADHAAIDTIDLLLTLRDLMRDDLVVRGRYQALFDHILVDELQDTDPLQSEVLLYLAEQAPRARRWEEVMVGPGRLTLVGDPKQSIYRFRRADVGMYQAIRDQIARGPHVAVTLSANFRSAPLLIAWANHRFAKVLGIAPAAGQRFDATTGQVFHQPQLPGTSGTSGPRVHALRYACAEDETRVGPARRVEAAAVAAYLRHLVEQAQIEVRDPDTGEPRAVRWGDIVVLALVTSNVGNLTAQLDAQGVPYAAAGGKLFTSDPLHQTFLLALRALADRHDGVAEAALLRPPFFGVDLLDLIRNEAGATDAAAARGAAARAWVREARRQRFTRTPGQTARALLEETGLGRSVALGPNGAQRLRHLRELCLQLEARAAAEGLDFDGITARMRDWLVTAPRIDPPRPVGVDAVQLLTVHAAKGLEFPVVVLWDGVGGWPSTSQPVPWTVERAGAGWAVKFDDAAWEEPAEGGLRAREKAFDDAERRRLVYVAATRARDLLVIPVPAWEASADKTIHRTLLDDLDDAWVHTPATFVDGKGAAWSRKLSAPRTSTRPANDAKVHRAWDAARITAQAPRFAPMGVAAAAKAAPVNPADTELEPAPPRPPRVSRYGALFGDVVHEALGLVVTRGVAVEEAVARAAQIAGLREHLAEAIADVTRGREALVREALVGPSCTVRLEYPVATLTGTALLGGFIDLLTARGDTRAVIDFKTDAWPPGALDAATAFPAYAEQVRQYARIVGATRAGLLFTATGAVAWIDLREGSGETNTTICG